MYLLFEQGATFRLFPSVQPRVEAGTFVTRWGAALKRFRAVKILSVVERNSVTAGTKARKHGPKLGFGATSYNACKSEPRWLKFSTKRV
jgi:hypothetical protein